MEEDRPLIHESGILSQSAATWAEARRRAAVLGPLAEHKHFSIALASDASVQLGLSVRTVYTLMRRYKESGGSLLALAPAAPQGGRGGSRLPAATERIVAATIADQYVSRQRLPIATIVRDIRHRCHLAGITPPADNTIRARIRRLPPDQVVRRREGRDAARRLQAAGGQFPLVSGPLDVVQIDHTRVDVMVVDAFSRELIGRPWLTIGIDVYSRCITGFCLTLESPTAVSVGLCLAHGAAEKQPWLDDRGITAAWPVHGKPRSLHMDNGPEFHSEALRRGCEVHGIQMHYRPPGEPHFGGIIERVIGTFMHMVHELPGTTFANPSERGTYDAEGLAALTLTELEHWLALAITGQYHESLHTGIGTAPRLRWEHGIHEQGPPPPLRDPKAFLIDFLPVVKRHIQRQGFVIDHIGYFSPALRPWIAARDQGHVFLIRRDPRDLSRIWVLHPEEHHYLEVPYRTIAHPAVTLWEHRQALARLRATHAVQHDEAAIFAAIQAMRHLAQQATTTTKATRRAHARREHLRTAATPLPIIPPPQADDTIALPLIQPFSTIEEW